MKRSRGLLRGRRKRQSCGELEKEEEANFQGGCVLHAWNFALGKWTVEKGRDCLVDYRGWFKVEKERAD